MNRYWSICAARYQKFTIIVIFEWF